MGRQRPATDTFRAIDAGTLERLAGLHSSTNKHSNVLKELATAVPGALLILAREYLSTQYGTVPLRSPPLALDLTLLSGGCQVPCAGPGPL